MDLHLVGLGQVQHPAHAVEDRGSGPGRLVGVCGDGWGPSPKVETAWLSGTRLGRALAQRLG